MRGRSSIGLRRGGRCSLALILSLAGMPAVAQEAGISNRIRERMQQFVDQQQISGSVTLVGQGDRIVSVEAVGRRSIEDDLPMRPDTLFRIASMTKPITAIAIMMLVDAGKLTIDDPVEKPLPEFRGQMMIVGHGRATRSPSAKTPRPITIRDLLTHTSGLPTRLRPGSRRPRFPAGT